MHRRATLLHTRDCALFFRRVPLHRGFSLPRNEPSSDKSDPSRAFESSLVSFKHHLSTSFPNIPLHLTAIPIRPNRFCLCSLFPPRSRCFDMSTRARCASCFGNVDGDLGVFPIFIEFFRNISRAKTRHSRTRHRNGYIFIFEYEKFSTRPEGTEES